MMIVGIGIDSVKIERIKKTIQSTGKFKNKVFTEAEIKYCEKKKNPYESFAARFAAKEAFAKAIGTGVGKDFTWKDIEVINDEYGKPALNILNNRYLQNKNVKVHISLTHTDTDASAYIILENLDS